MMNFFIARVLSTVENRNERTRENLKCLGRKIHCRKQVNEGKYEKNENNADSMDATPFNSFQLNAKLSGNEDVQHTLLLISEKKKRKQKRKEQRIMTTAQI